MSTPAQTLDDRFRQIWTTNTDVTAVSPNANLPGMHDKYEATDLPTIRNTPLELPLKPHPLHALLHAVARVSPDTTAQATDAWIMWVCSLARRCPAEALRLASTSGDTHHCLSCASQPIYCSRRAGWLSLMCGTYACGTQEQGCGSRRLPFR